MALFAISDLHLPIGVDKPMDIFGSKWSDYVGKLEKNWNAIVSDDDLVVLPGDFSWATYINQAIPDFLYLHNLKGKKIILKGNHDYWWTTKAKLDEFLRENKFLDIEILNNNSFIYNDIAICGTRGWSYIGYGEAGEDDKKIYERELGRLRLSIEDAKKHNPKEIIVFLHYPPITKDFSDSGFVQILKEYDIKLCVYGHLHAQGHKNAVNGVYDGIEYKLVSCDYRDFVPVKLRN